jgi:RNA polymerase sporulation-specific sigma factor
MGDTPNSKTLGETVAAGSDSDPEMRLVIEELPRIIMAEDSKILSKMERQVFSYMLEGKDYKSIAEIMGKSPKSIDNCIQRIRSKIKHFLEE